MPRYKIVNTIFLLVIIFVVIIDWQSAVDWKVYTGIIFVFILLQGYGALYMSSNFFLPAICAGDIHSDTIAITFDDGPLPGKTADVLAVLKAHQVEACFFCIGSQVERNPAIMKHVLDEGHIVGNHSFHHGWNFDLLSAAKMREELKRTDDAIAAAVGKKPAFFRPPYGVTNPNLATAVGDDYTSIGWTVRSFDTTIHDPTKLMKRITRGLKAGDIVLFHEHGEATLTILPDFIKHVQSIGLKIVRLDRLIGESPYTSNT